MSQIKEIQVDVDRLFFSRNSNIGLKTILSRILLHIGNNETGQQFCRSYLSPFFQLLGKVPVCKQFLKFFDRGFAVVESHIFNNLIDILS